jgi:ATP diphosphatase
MSNLTDSYKRSVITGKNHRDVFDWASPSEVVDKVIEEAKELKEALKNQKEGLSSQSDTEVFSEASDLSFALVQVLRHLNIDLEDCLNFSNEKFKLRFEGMLKIASQKKTELKDLNTKELEDLWTQSKKKTKYVVDELSKGYVSKTR